MGGSKIQGNVEIVSNILKSSLSQTGSYYRLYERLVEPHNFTSTTRNKVLRFFLMFVFVFNLLLGNIIYV